VAAVVVVVAIIAVVVVVVVVVVVGGGGGLWVVVGVGSRGPEGQVVMGGNSVGRRCRVGVVLRPVHHSSPAE